MLLTFLVASLLAAAPPESEIAADPPADAAVGSTSRAEATPVPDVAEGPVPAPEGGAPVSAPAAPVPADPAPAAASTVEPAPAVEPAPEASVTKKQPRDNARSHESRWGFGVAGLAHSARPGRAAVIEHPDPGAALTTELRLVRGENSQLWLGLEGALWRDDQVSRTVALRAQFGYRLILGMGLGFEMYGGPGLAFHRYQQAALQCACTDGRPRQTGFVGGMGVGMLYDFGQVSRVPIAVYGRYEAFIERHLGASEFYLVPHQAVHVGVRLTIPGRRR